MFSVHQTTVGCCGFGGPMCAMSSKAGMQEHAEKCFIREKWSNEDFT